MLRLLFPFLLVTIFFTACDQSSTTKADEDGITAMSGDSLAKHVSVLASDSFEGRKPFTRAEEKTINYLRDQFIQEGLEPGNGSSYFQDVPMVNIATKAAPTMQVKSAKQNFDLKGFDDYVIFTDKTNHLITLKDNEFVFAGYGVVAPEYNWNDYAGLDVKDKIVLVLVNDPGFNNGDTTLFKGKTMTYYGRWTYKFEEAARQGARGCLVIHSTAAASYPFTVVQNSWNTSKLHLDDREKGVKYSDVIGWISKPATIKLLEAAGLDSTVLAKADQPGFKPMPLGVSGSTSMTVTATYNKSHNVVAKITGTRRPDEVIIYSAHWDHLGIGKPDETGDSIYNGAYDNASGAAALLELARAFKSMKKKPERTVIFLAVTAEEQGLWGSAYYAQNPLYPVEKTVANINMDGVNPFEKTNDIIIVGQGQNELEDYMKDAAQKAGRSISFDTHPEAGSYYRSDHFSFAKVGIPAIDTKNGIDVVGKGKEFGQKQRDDYTKDHYHRPSDQINLSTWKFEGGVENLKLLFTIGKRLAFESTMPQWKEGSEFKKLRK